MGSAFSLGVELEEFMKLEGELERILYSVSETICQLGALVDLHASAHCEFSLDLVLTLCLVWDQEEEGLHNRSVSQPDPEA